MVRWLCIFSSQTFMDGICCHLSMQGRPLHAFLPTYRPPGLMTMAPLLRVSSSTSAMLCLAFWYESSVAHTVILSWIPAKQSSWMLPSLCPETERGKLWKMLGWITGKQLIILTGSAGRHCQTALGTSMQKFTGVQKVTKIASESYFN